eukprot:Skav217566  [mRNA]  locus=scaffold1602:646981:647235:+ [translate_table: standard]
MGFSRDELLRSAKLHRDTGVLEPPLTLALGEKASTRIANLKYTTRQMLMHLQHLTEVYQAGPWITMDHHGSAAWLWLVGFKAFR